MGSWGHWTRSGGSWPRMWCGQAACTKRFIKATCEVLTLAATFFDKMKWFKGIPTSLHCCIWELPGLAPHAFPSQQKKKEGFCINRLWPENSKDNWGRKKACSQKTNVRRWQCSVKHKQWNKRQNMGETDLKRRRERGNWMTEKGLHWGECVFSPASGESM